MGSVVSPAQAQMPGGQNDPFSGSSSRPVIMVNYKTPSYDDYGVRQIDLFLLIVAVLYLAGVMGTQISHLVMALPGVDVSTIGNLTLQ